MIGRRTIPAFALSVFALALVAPIPSAATTDHDVMEDYRSGKTSQRFFEALNAWDLKEAEGEWEKMMISSAPEDAWPVYCEAVLRFYQSRYKESATRFEQLTSEFELSDQMASYVAFYQNAMKVPLKFRSKETDKFIFHYLPEDEILASYVLETMERVRQVIGEDLGFFPEEKVVIEAMPSRQAFIDASPLTRENIETSGTIALCKYNRLMFTTPRVLYQGYGWLETLAHEYVHYAVSRLSRNRVPIWLHEGMAKYQQGRPFDGGMGRTPETVNILARAMEEEYFITFARMSPSMAKLDSRNDVRLAFAEVSHAFEWMLERKGYDGVRDLLKRLTHGVELETALEKIYGMGLLEIEAELKRFIASKGYKYEPRLEEIPLSFKEDLSEEEGRTEDGEEEETRQIASETSRDFAKIGDLLRQRSYLSAAEIEYGKGIESSPTFSPRLSNKLALVRMLQEKWEEALRELERMEPLYPGYATSLKRLGVVNARLDRPQKARKYLEKAIGHNPFDPEIHAELERIYAQLDLPELAQRASETFKALGGAAPSPTSPHPE